MKSVTAEVTLSVAASRALDLFTEPADLRGWWGVERALVEKREGGPYTLAWGLSDAGIKYVSSGIVRAYRPGARLEVGGFVYLSPDRPILGPMSLTVVVEARGAGTHLAVCQDGYRDGPDWDWYYDAVLHAWPSALVQLKTYVER
jgi:uncharacterized protein YndB with AHSA1/START domain